MTNQLQINAVFNNAYCFICCREHAEIILSFSFAIIAIVHDAILSRMGGHFFYMFFFLLLIFWGLSGRDGPENDPQPCGLSK